MRMALGGCAKSTWCDNAKYLTPMPRQAWASASFNPSREVTAEIFCANSDATEKKSMTIRVGRRGRGLEARQSSGRLSRHFRLGALKRAGADSMNGGRAMAGSGSHELA